jgi:Holliday junction resolvasome RuvABC endonuclease subunit
MAYSAYIDTAITRHLPHMSFSTLGKRRSALLDRGWATAEPISVVVDRLLKEVIMPYAAANLVSLAFCHTQVISKSVD